MNRRCKNCGGRGHYTKTCPAREPIPPLYKLCLKKVARLVVNVQDFSTTWDSIKRLSMLPTEMRLDAFKYIVCHMNDIGIRNLWGNDLGFTSIDSDPPV